MWWGRDTRWSECFDRCDLQIGVIERAQRQ